ncbi:hypothetical protein Gura_1638 [Geotalea uraniireducens Rf4]|uniref:DUF4124 domain-containing protein n=2 Tax=Geotalea uraniireducens TaxID=351604 RepID=A5GEH8_GEOUR|nr:hypothetical protein Gura_1638 [Geotalea uraniireducens Rf4]
MLGGIMKKLMVMLLFVASSAYGEFYTWTDSRGVAHYTNSTYEIPARYRAKAKVVNLGIDQKSDPSSAQPNGQVQPAKPEGQPAIPGAGGNIIQQNAPTPPVTVAPAVPRQQRIERKQRVRRNVSREMED